MCGPSHFSLAPERGRNKLQTFPQRTLFSSKEAIAEDGMLKVFGRHFVLQVLCTLFRLSKKKALSERCCLLKAARFVRQDVSQSAKVYLCLSNARGLCTVSCFSLPCCKNSLVLSFSCWIPQCGVCRRCQVINVDLRCDSVMQGVVSVRS